MRPSARFGQAGLTLLSGHDDVAGSIFRDLGTPRRGDVIQVWDVRRSYRYTVSTVQIVTPDNVSMLSAPRVRPTLALVSCYPFWTDTHRVVIAQMG